MRTPSFISTRRWMHARSIRLRRCRKALNTQKVNFLHCREDFLQTRCFVGICSSPGRSWRPIVRGLPRRFGRLKPKYLRAFPNYKEPFLRLKSGEALNANKYTIDRAEFRCGARGDCGSCRTTSGCSSKVVSGLRSLAQEFDQAVDTIPARYKAVRARMAALQSAARVAIRSKTLANIRSLVKAACCGSAKSRACPPTERPSSGMGTRCISNWTIRARVIGWRR